MFLWLVKRKLRYFPSISATTAAIRKRIRHSPNEIDEKRSTKVTQGIVRATTEGKQGCYFIGCSGTYRTVRCGQKAPKVGGYTYRLPYSGISNDVGSFSLDVPFLPLVFEYLRNMRKKGRENIPAHARVLFLDLNSIVSTHSFPFSLPVVDVHFPHPLPYPLPVSPSFSL